MAQFTVPLNKPHEHDALCEHALKTLLEISQYVDSPRFTAAGLASGGIASKNADTLQKELDWLREHGYVSLIDEKRRSYSLTHEGKHYESEAEDDESGHFEIAMTSSDEEKQPLPNENPHDDSRGDFSFTQFSNFPYGRSRGHLC